MKTSFLDLLRESVIIQGVVTIITIVTISYLYIQGRDVPNELFSLVGLIIGFYFGSKSNYQAMRTIQANTESKGE